MVVGLLLVVALSLVLFTYLQGRAAAHAMARDSLRVVGERIVDRFDKVMDAPTLFTIMASVAAPQDDPTVHRIAFAKEAIDQSPEIDGIYLGRGNGQFLQAVPLGPPDDPWRTATGAPSQAVYAFGSVQVGPTAQRMRSWTFLDAAGQKIGTGAPEPTDYDPRTRPWYQAALAVPGPILTRPYQMAVTREHGVTIARRHVDDLSTVVAVDILLKTFSGFLASEKISVNGRSYLFDREGQLFAHSDPAAMRLLIRALEGDASARTALAADRALSRLQALAPSQNRDDVVIMDDDGADWLMQTRALPEDGVLAGYKIGLAAPLQDFTGPSERLAQRGLMLSAIVIVGGILVALLVAWRLGRSLAGLTEAARRLEDLDFRPEPVQVSNVAEITALSHALTAASAAIRTFALYVPKEIVRAIVKTGGADARSARRQDITVLFTDIRDFTTICEGTEPEAVVEMLSAYFDLLSEGVYAHGGAIIQFLGDSIYASWNAPTPDPDHVDHACACALTLVAKIDRFNAAQVAADKPVFITRLGLHTGHAVVGSVGSAERLQYTGMGDTVNVASRLEGLNKQFGTSILASEAVYLRCKAGLNFRELGEVQVKGRNESLRVFELLEPHGKPSA
jgi:adenylate cyclase